MSNWSNSEPYKYYDYCDYPEDGEVYRFKYILHTISSIVNLGLLQVVCVMGLIGNLICAVIVFRKKFRSSSFFNLIGTLAIIDSACLIKLSFGESYFYYDYAYCKRDENDTVWLYWGPIWKSMTEFNYYTVHFSLQSASFYLLVLINIERFMAVFYPLKVRIVFTRKNTIAIILWIFVLCAFIQTNWIRELVMSRVEDEYNFRRDLCNTTEEEVKNNTMDNADQKYGNCTQEAKDLFSSWTKTALFYTFYLRFTFVGCVIPFVSVLILNCLIFYGIHRAKKQRKQLMQINHARTSNVDMDSDLLAFTKMIAKSNCVFLFCSISYLVDFLTFSIEVITWGNPLIFFECAFFPILNALNSALNPLIYTIDSPLYRKEQKKLFTFRRKGTVPETVQQSESTVAVNTRVSYV